MDTREQILQTALRQFSRRGYHAVSIRDICGEVGIKESSLYYHFTNKRALLEALLERFAQKAAHFTRLLDEGTAQPAGMDDAAFLQVGEGYVQGYLLDPEILCFFGMLRIERENDPALAALYREWYFERPLQFQTSMFERLAQAEYFPAGQAQRLALLYLAPILFFYERELPLDGEDARARLLQAVRRHLEDFLKEHRK